MTARIAVAKIAWSEHYEGGQVRGRYGYLTMKRGEGHECFNFKRGPDGRFYAYIPPIGKTFAIPKPTVTTGWLVVFVSARNGDGPLTIVGWYENARFENERKRRPEYDLAPFETDADGNEFEYSISASTAVLVPPEHRLETVSGVHLRRTPIAYLRGGAQVAPWRRKLAARLEKLINKPFPATPEGASAAPPGFPGSDPALKKAVEEASVDAAKVMLRQLGYRYIKDRQKDRCGYDLFARKSRSSAAGELWVEVKGTSREFRRFYITKNEVAQMSSPKWRMILVTNALQRPVPEILTAASVDTDFDLKPLVYIGIDKQ